MKKAIVIGSGFSGCMFAMMLKEKNWDVTLIEKSNQVGGGCLLYTSPSPRDRQKSRMPSSA